MTLLVTVRTKSRALGLVDRISRRIRTGRLAEPLKFYSRDGEVRSVDPKGAACFFMSRRPAYAERTALSATSIPCRATPMAGRSGEACRLAACGHRQRMNARPSSALAALPCFVTGRAAFNAGSWAGIQVSRRMMIWIDGTPGFRSNGKPRYLRSP